MQTKYESRVRGLAISKGMELVRVETSLTSADKIRLFKLVSENGITIFPTGRGIEGARLQDAEDWLLHPWE
jgi:hypothetical protein